MTNQEIRNCIYNGIFNEFLKEAVEYKNYLNLFNVDPDKKDRFSNEELVLRFLSFTYNRKHYKGQLSKFLNSFMDTHRKSPEENIEKFRQLFRRTIDLIYMKILNLKSLPKLSKATTEALFVGVANNLENLEKESHEELLVRYNNLRKDDLFSVDSLKEGLAQKDKVINRLNKSIEIFA